MTVVRSAESRRTSTRNAVMTTLASPTQGGAGLAVWRVEMVPGAAGPLHTFDAEQIWTALDGAATIDLDGERVDARIGDTVIMSAGRPRRIHADAAAGFTAIVVAPAGARATAQGGEPVVPGWIA